MVGCFLLAGCTAPTEVDGGSADETFPLPKDFVVRSDSGGAVASFPSTSVATEFVVEDLVWIRLQGYQEGQLPEMEGVHLVVEWDGEPLFERSYPESSMEWVYVLAPGHYRVVFAGDIPENEGMTPPVVLEGTFHSHSGGDPRLLDLPSDFYLDTYGWQGSGHAYLDHEFTLRSRADLTLTFHPVDDGEVTIRLDRNGDPYFSWRGGPDEVLPPLALEKGVYLLNLEVEQDITGYVVPDEVQEDFAIEGRFSRASA